MFKILPIVGAIFLMGCVEQTAEKPIDLETGGEPMECRAAELQDLVGQPATVLQTMRFAGEVRFLPPGTITTKDFVLSRLNIVSDEAGVITMVNCG
jgi:hypothetical protein